MKKPDVKGKIHIIKGKWNKYSRIKKGCLISGMVMAAVGGGYFLIFGRSSARHVMAADTAVMEVTAQTGTISDTIIGTGNLEDQDGVPIKIPSGVLIEKVQVESGDRVSQGDVLATVDRTSVYSSMETVQAAIEELDEQINESKDNSEEVEVAAKVDGRIKKLFIEENQDLTQAMIEEGAVMLLSIDGKMAVEIQMTEAVAEDDAVIVTCSDNKEIEGTVENVNGETCTVTMSDKSVDAGETVSVSTEDGAELGKGQAYIHQKLAVTGTTGIIEDVAVTENEWVSEGDKLYTVKNDGTSVEYQKQMAMREAYAETLQELIALSQTGSVTADRDGTIETVLVSDGADEKTTEVSENSSAGNAVNTMNSNTSGGVQLLNLTSVSTYGGESAGCTDADDRENSTENNTEGSTEEPAQGSDPDDTGEEEEKPDSSASKKLQLSVVSEGNGNAQTLVLAKPVKGKVPQKEVAVSDCSYTGKIEWTPVTETFAPSTSYQAKVTLQSSDGYCFGTESIQMLETGIVSGICVTEDQKILNFTITFPETEAEILPENNTQDKSSQTDQKQTQGNQNPVSQTSGNNVENSRSISPSVSTAAASSQVTEVSAESGDDTSVEEYSTDTTAFTICSGEEMILSVNVDELDINSAKEGQEAEVTMDALEDQVFTGKVTRIGNTASVNGGVAKYTVEITIPKTEEMKAGMNASATIVIEKKENVITIPVNALQERGGESYVYTKKDEEGNLSGEQQVSTGLSDGSIVEITEGLSEGDTIYYQKTGNVDTSSQRTKMDSQEMGPGGMREGDGTFPGGDAPQGMGTPPGM